MIRTFAILAVICLSFGTALSGHAGSTPQQVDPADFSPVITNPLFPLSTLGPKVFEGEDIDPDTGDVIEERLESAVLPETKVIAGVTALVLEEKAYEDGVLVELALDYFAQHRDGSVWYFGEHVDNYEDGVLRDHEGQWLAGDGDNEPGIIMPAQPVVGATYQQENAPGIAEDMATVLALNESVTVPSGTYDGCMRTREFTPLEPDIEETKWHCTGVGLVKEEAATSVLELASIAPAPAPSPTPAATATPAVVPPPAGVTAPDTGDGFTQRPSLLIVAAGLLLLAVAAGTLVTGLRRLQ